MEIFFYSFNILACIIYFLYPFAFKNKPKKQTTKIFDDDFIKLSKTNLDTNEEYEVKIPKHQIDSLIEDNVYLKKQVETLRKLNQS